MLQTARDTIAAAQPGVPEHGEFVVFSPRGLGFRLAPRYEQGVIVYSNRSLYLGLYWFLTAGVFVGLAGYVWATRTPIDTLAFLLTFGAIAIVLTACGFWMAMRHQRVEFDTDRGRCRGTTRYDLKIRRSERSLDELRIVRCRIFAAEGRFPKRHGVVAIFGDDCLPLASVGSIAAREKYLEGIPEQLSPYIQDGDASLLLVIRVL